MTAAEIMQTNLVTINPKMSVRHAAKILADNDMSAIPVVNDEGVLLGIVSESDLIHRLAHPHLPPYVEILGGVIYLENPFEMKKEFKKLTAITAEEIMTTKVATVSPDTDISNVATIMVEKNINGIPVVKDNKIIGIVTRHDLVLNMAKNYRNGTDDTIDDKDSGEEQ